MAREAVHWRTFADIFADVTDTIRMMALSGLAYEDEAPLGWKPLAALPEGFELQQLNTQAAHLLQVNASLEEHRSAQEPNDDSQPLFQELHRLEFKLDMVLRFMSSLLQQQHGIPPRRRFRIHAQGLEWSEPAKPVTTGTFGLISLYLNRGLPYPIELPGELTTTFVAGAETALRVEFRGLNAQVSDLIEKLIFRHHRRQIAEARDKTR